MAMKVAGEFGWEQVEEAGAPLLGRGEALRCENGNARRTENYQWRISRCDQFLMLSHLRDYKTSARLYYFDVFFPKRLF